MKIVFLGNNWLGWKAVEHLGELNENIVGLVLHSGSNRKFGNRIINCAGVDSDDIFEDKQLSDPSVIKAIDDRKPDMAISVLFSSILNKEFIRIFPKGVINLHPSYLPFNRGAYPNVWSIIDGTTAGVTIHFIDEGIDTGDILFQKKVSVEVFDTGESLYKKLENASLELFKKSWHKIKKGKFTTKKQYLDEGTYHITKDVENIDEIDLNKDYNALKLLNIIRARTYPPYKGAYFKYKGKKIYLRLDLIPEKNLKS